MTTTGVRSLVLSLLMACMLVMAATPASACPYQGGCVNLDDGAADFSLTDSRVGAVAGAGPDVVDKYAWRLRTLCMLADEAQGECSPFDFRECPQIPGRVIGYYVVQWRPLVYPGPNGEPTAEVPLQPKALIGQQVGTWSNYNGDGACLDITSLNPPPSPAEVFTYFERLPLPLLTVQHQPPGDGLSGLPVIFYTDSPTTQTFTVDIRGFTVVINAAAESYTWHTGDPAASTIVSTDPGEPYPDHTIEHDYRSGTYTAHLTVTWGATFTVNGSAPTDVDGTTTTDGPPVSFDVLQARSVLTNPYD